MMLLVIQDVPLKIWIGDGNRWKQTGHGPRIKAEIPTIKSSKNWPSITIPDKNVENNIDKNNGKQLLSNYYIKLLKKFIEYNQDNLNKLINTFFGMVGTQFVSITDKNE